MAQSQLGGTKLTSDEKVVVHRVGALGTLKQKPASYVRTCRLDGLIFTTQIATVGTGCVVNVRFPSSLPRLCQQVCVSRFQFRRSHPLVAYRALAAARTRPAATHHTALVPTPARPSCRTPLCWLAQVTAVQPIMTLANLPHPRAATSSFD